MWDDQSTRALEDISTMEKSSIDAANAQRKRWKAIATRTRVLPIFTFYIF